MITTSNRSLWLGAIIIICASVGLTGFAQDLPIKLKAYQPAANSCLCLADLASKQYISRKTRRSYVFPLVKLTFVEFSCRYRCETPGGAVSVEAAHKVKFHKERGNEVVCAGVEMDHTDTIEPPYIRYYNPRPQLFDARTSDWKSLQHWARKNCSAD